MSETALLLDLRPDHWDIVRGILRQHVPGRKVLAFGSRATWTAKDYSDLDLAILGNEPLSVDVTSGLAEGFRESDLPFKVDLVDWTRIDEAFRTIIRRDGVTVQVPEQEARARDGARLPKMTSTGSDDEWPILPLGDCIVMNEETFSSKDAWLFVNYLDTGSITENRISDIQHLTIGQDKIPSRARRKAQSGDIVYSTVRPNQRHFGLLKKVPDNFLVSTGFAVFRGMMDYTDTGFIYWFLSQDHIVEQLHTIAEHSTSAYPSIRPTDIERLQVALPSLAEQRAIAHILGILDDKIELNRRMNETLEAMARALFKSWFVDFDPVRAKMEGRDTGLPKHIADLFSDKFFDSVLGPIPEGWTPGELADVADNPHRVVHPSDVPPTTLYIGLQHMPRRSIALDTWSFASKVDSGKSQFKKGEILFGKLRPYFHKVGIAPADGVCSTDILVIIPKSNEWHGYVLSLVSSEAFVDYTDSRSSGTKMPRANWKDMGCYQLALPPAPLTKAFQSHVATLHQRISVAVRQNNYLIGLRDTLLPKLINGQIELPSTQAAAEEVGT